jgi:hypothetical protein
MGNVLYLQAGSILSPSELGHDTIRRRWICKTSLVDSLRPREGDVDLVHRSLKYWTCEITENGPVSEMATVFNGFRDRAQSGRVVKSRFGTQLQEVPVNLIGSQVRVMYFCPTVTNRYACPKRPDDSERPAALPDGKCKVFDIRGDDDATISNAEHWTSVLEEQSVVYPSIERTNFEREQEGSVWIVTEIVQRILRARSVEYRL